jgi:hypothetical protein
MLIIYVDTSVFGCVKQVPYTLKRPSEINPALQILIAEPDW